jgi:hypothetical protein
MPDVQSQPEGSGVGSPLLDSLRQRVQMNPGTIAHKREAAPSVPPNMLGGLPQLPQQHQQGQVPPPPGGAGGPSPLAHPGQAETQLMGAGTPMQQQQGMRPGILPGSPQNVNPQLQQQPPPIPPNMLSLMGSQHEAEANRDGGGAVKTEDLPAANADGLSKKPSGPPINRDTWKPNALNPNGNLEPVDTEMRGSPHPDETIDILEAIPANRDDDFLDGTRSVTETQDLPSANDDGYSTDKNTETIHTDTWSQNNGASPVTSNFLSRREVDAAIRDYDYE